MPEARAGLIFESALRRLEPRRGRVPVTAVDIGPAAIERPLIHRPLELADQPRIKPQAFDGLNVRVARRGFGT